MIQTKHLYLIIILALLPINLVAQPEINNKYFTAYDSVIGIENTNLLNGTRFIDAYRSTEFNHRYFKTRENLIGSLVYESQPYFNLNLKYDLYKDQLILEIPGDKKYFNINLISSKISAFTIGSHQFINFYKNPDLQTIGIQGFLELAFTGDSLKVYIKHEKSKKETIKDSKIIHKYKNYNYYILSLNDKFYRIKSKKTLKKTFPNQSKFISDFYKSNSLLLNKDKNLFMITLFRTLDVNLKNTSN